MTTRGQLNQSNLLFENSGTNFLTLTATSNGIGTFSSNSGNVRLSGILNPSSDQDVATKNYVDSIAGAGATWKNSVAVATTTNGDLNTVYASGQTVDGVILVTSDRILIKDQTTATENGIYTVNATGAPTRSDDFLTSNTVAGAAVWVNEGTANADKGFICTNDAGSDVVGTDNLTFTNFSSAPSIAGSNTQVQFNNNGSFGASNDFIWNGTSLKLADSKEFVTGTDNDLTMVHNGTNGSLTNTTGNLNFDNQNVTGSIIFNLGTDTSATSFQVENDSGTDILNIDGSGLVLYNSGSTISHLDNVTSKWGTGNDFTVVHDGTDSIITSTTGNLKFDNTNVTGSTVFTLGTNTTATKFTIENDSNSNLFQIKGDGNIILGNSTSQTITHTGGSGDFTITSGSNVNIENITFNGDDISGLPSIPSSDTSAVSKLYVDNENEKSNFKNSVTCATITNGDLNTVYASGQTVDGVVLVTGDRILIKDQTTATENGIYTVNATGAPTRSVDLNTNSSAASIVVIVEEGTENSDKIFICTSNSGSDVVGTDSLAFTNLEGEPDGSNTQVQFNNNGDFGASSDFTWNGTSLHLTDSKEFVTGTDNDLTIVHNGTDGSVTNTTGNLIIENSNASSDIKIKLGDNSASTNFVISDSLESPILSVSSDDAIESVSTTTGTVKIVGGLGVTLDISANAVNCTSDATLKTNINPLSNPLETINKIDGYSYEWIKDKGNGNKMWGVLAQQLEEVGLEHIVTNGAEHKSVNYIQLIPLMIEAIKELSKNR